MPTPWGIKELFLLGCPAAYRALLAVGQSVAFRTQPRVCNHGAVVGEATLAPDACFAISAARVENSFQVSPAMPEFRRRFVSCAGCASVWPRFRRAVVAHPAAFRAVPQLAALESLLAQAASAKHILLL